MNQVVTIRVNATAFDDHYTRCYYASYDFVDGQRVTVYPILHADDLWNIEHGKSALGQEIHGIKTMVATRGYRTVTLTLAAVAEMLSDFDFYASEAMRGEYEANLVRAMRAAAKSIRKQLGMEVK
jgi:hypothetical protein